MRWRLPPVVWSFLLLAVILLGLEWLRNGTFDWRAHYAWIEEQEPRGR